MSHIKIVDVQSGKEIERPMTEAELKDWQDGIDFQENMKKIKLSALAKLAALGLTEDEIAAL